VLAVVPLILETGRAVKANLSLDAGLLAAIDEAAAARGLTRSAFLASAAREKIAAEG
jgi:metal-responsive CopG/Arc/MetJ family transcriptional regulator